MSETLYQNAKLKELQESNEVLQHSLNSANHTITNFQSYVSVEIALRDEEIQMLKQQLSQASSCQNVKPDADIEKQLDKMSQLEQENEQLKSQIQLKDNQISELRKDIKVAYVSVGVLSFFWANPLFISFHFSLKFNFKPAKPAILLYCRTALIS